MTAAFDCKLRHGLITSFGLQNHAVQDHTSKVTTKTRLTQHYCGNLFAIMLIAPTSGTDLIAGSDGCFLVVFPEEELFLFFLGYSFGEAS